MKTTKKTLILVIIASLSSGQNLQAKYREMAQESYEYLKKAPYKAKAKASQAWDKAEKTWASIDPSTKENIKSGLIAAGAIAGAGIAAGTGYALWQDQDTPTSPLGADPTQDQETLNELIRFLSSSPEYKGDVAKQKGFLDRFNLNQQQKQEILATVMIAEKQQTIQQR